MEDQIQYAGQILGVTLFVVGLVVSWVVWRRKGAAFGLRGVAWSSLLLAAGLIGLINALWTFVGQLIGNILNPLMWAGLGAAGFAVLLYIISGVMKARGMGTKGRAKKSDAQTQEQPKAAGGSGAAGQVGAGSKSGSGAGAGAGGGNEDFSDIEAILRDRGIS